MNALVVDGIRKSFGTVQALRGVDLESPVGSITALLGPSGCGKTTLLRIIAGFERPDGGEVTAWGEVITGPHVWKPAERRSIGYVAQEGALFPHLTVRRNLEYALPRAERREGRRLAELLDLVNLEVSQLQRFPHELSGGQQQRVALARALARRPKLVLLDEPFAALDAGLRASTRQLVAEALDAEKVSSLLVTHDQQEALSFADRLVVMKDGMVQQTGTPREVYTRPANPWVADFLGDAITLRGVASGKEVTCALGRLPTGGPPVDGAVTVLLRPEQLHLMHLDRSTSEAVAADVIGTTFFGHDSVVELRLVADPEQRLTARAAGAAVFPVGSRVGIGVNGPAMVFRPGPGSARLVRTP